MISQPIDTKASMKRAGPDIAMLEPSTRKQPSNQASNNSNNNRNFSKPKSVFTRVPMGDILSMCGLINRNVNVYEEIFLPEELPQTYPDTTGKTQTPSSTFGSEKQTLIEGLSQQKSSSDSLISSGSSPINRSKLQDYLSTSSHRTSAYLETSEEQSGDLQSRIVHRLPFSFLTESHVNNLETTVKDAFAISNEQEIENDEDEDNFTFIEVGDLID